MIEDDASIRSVICRLLSGRGHEVIEAKDGEGGKAAFFQTFFDLVVCDLLLATQNGIETIRRIRKLDAKVPIIAISGTPRLDSFSMLDDAMGVGANAMIEKPFEADDFLATVSDLLDHSQT